MSKPTWSNAFGCSATSVFFGRRGSSGVFNDASQFDQGAADGIVFRSQFTPARSRSSSEEPSLRNYES